MIKKLLCIAAFCTALFSASAFADTKKPYYIEVNRAANIVSVYEADEKGTYTNNVKNFICSTGEDTPDGTFKTSDKYEWRFLFGDVYGQYATRITGHILFHSVPYYTQDKNNLEYEEYNKLGTSASMGCIRLRVSDAKWIYDNCPSGTVVKIFYDENAAPVEYEKPITIDVNDIEKRGWDPTDPDENNPWKKEIAQTVEGTYYINGEKTLLKSCIIDGENYMYIRDAGKFFKGCYISYSDKNKVEFKYSKYYHSKSSSVLDYFSGEYKAESRIVDLYFGGKKYRANSQTVNSCMFIKLSDAAKIFGAEINSGKEYTAIKY